MKKLTALLLAACMLLSLPLAGCKKQNDEAVATGGGVNISSQSESSKASGEAGIKQPATVRVMAVGDNLIHSSIYKQAKQRGGKSYDFDYAYSHVEDIIKLAELPIINQETVIAPDYEPSDYPCFNSPPELGQKMIDLGFRAFNHANNHILDVGTGGVKSLLKYWAGKRKKYDIVNTGIYKNENDLNAVKKLTVGGITFSFIGITQHTNGISLPGDSELEVIYTDEEKLIKSQIKRAKAESDVVVMNAHWGTEDSHEVTANQRSLAEKMVGWGADIIIGTHPHVLQKIEMLKKPDGSKAPVIYSLGNFISAQSDVDNMIGGIADMNVTKDFETGKVTVSGLKILPVITHYDSGFSDIRNYPYNEYNASLAASHGINAYHSGFTFEYITNLVNNVVGKKYFAKELK